MILIGNRYKILRETDYLEENKRYEVEDIKSSKKYFIKILEKGSYIKESFLPNLVDESMILQEINSPYILKIKDLGIHKTASEDLIYIVSEYMQGFGLDEMIRGDYLHYDALVRISVQILRAMEAYCREGRYHGSLKPSAIIVDEKYNIKIDDFGVTYANSGVNIRTGKNSFYLAPSQISVDYSDMESDLFSLGMILFESLFKRYPFIKTNNEQMLLKAMNMGMNGSMNPFSRIDTSTQKQQHRRFINVIKKLFTRMASQKYKSLNELSVELINIMYDEISRDYFVEEEVSFEAHLDKTGRLDPDVLHKTGKIDGRLIERLAEEQRKEREKAKLEATSRLKPAKASNTKHEVKRVKEKAAGGKTERLAIDEEFNDSYKGKGKTFVTSIFFKLTLGLLIILMVMLSFTYFI